MSEYEKKTWRYLVREWQQDGNLKLVLQTDSFDVAHERCNETVKSTHVYDVVLNEIVYRNYD